MADWNHMLSPREGDCSADLVRTPAWQKGVQSEDADCVSSSHWANLQKASSCQIREDVHPSVSSTSDRVEDIIYSHKACFLEEKVTKSF